MIGDFSEAQEKHLPKQLILMNPTEFHTYYLEHHPHFDPTKMVGNFHVTS